MKVSSRVPAPYDGSGVVAYLAGRFTYLPEAAWRQLLQEGRIRRNDAVCAESTAVGQGDIITCDVPDFAPPPVNFAYQVLYEDDWLLAVNKPAGLRVHSGGKFVTANLIYHLRHLRQPAYPEANLVNRLDADTSGLVLLARDPRVLGHLLGQFAAGTVKKDYLAVVAGCPTPASGTIDLPIGPVKEARIPRYWITTEGKAAVTRYQTLRKLNTGHSLLQLQPETGRTHQLRVHLAAIGHPILGDALYTMNDADYLDWRCNARPDAGFPRQALHSCRLQFLHPVQQTTCTLTAPLATDIGQFIRRAATTPG